MLDMIGKTAIAAVTNVRRNNLPYKEQPWLAFIMMEQYKWVKMTTRFIITSIFNTSFNYCMFESIIITTILSTSNVNIILITTTASTNINIVKFLCQIITLRSKIFTSFFIIKLKIDKTISDWTA